MADGSVTGRAVTGLSGSDLPGVHRAADATSLRGQRSYVQATRVRLVLVLVAAGAGVVLGRLDHDDTGYTVAAATAAAAFVAALMCEVYLLSQRPDRQWYDGRALAESSKTLAWRYAVGGEPFPRSGDPGAADELFVTRLRALQGTTPARLGGADPTTQAISPKMRAVREAPLADRRDAYLADRIQEQRRWYTGKAASNGSRAKAWRWALIVLEFLGFLAALSHVMGYDGPSLEGLIAAAVAGGGAWLQMKDHDSLERAYTTAALELEAIEALGDRAAQDEGSWATYVKDAEEAISREHTTWQASRSQRH
jgi:hypothetical protein